MASHQIRPQMTAVRGFVGMLFDREKDKDNKELLNLSATGIERTLRILADMLNLSEFTSGVFKLHKRPMDLVELIDNELLLVKPIALTAKMTVDFDTDVGMAPMSGDDIKLREVIANFLHNAIQYGTSGTTVHVRLVQANGMLRFTVRDQGIGVAETESKRLFTKFYRTKNAQEVRPAGSGVGLFLAKKVVEAHGGEVFYEPAHPGSTFGFSIPFNDKG
jgi:signal transduction histidine kinase